MSRVVVVKLRPAAGICAARNIEKIQIFSQLGFPKTQLMNELIELKYDTQLKAHFIEPREKPETH